MKKICELCRKEFEAKTANRRICYDEHYKVCKYCNNTFLLDPKEKVKHQIERDYCYDKECINKQKKDKTKQTSLEKYGVEHPTQRIEYKEQLSKILNSKEGKERLEKAKKTCLEKYGVENVFQSEIIKYKIKQTNLERYGVEHAIQNETIKEKAMETQKENNNGKLAWNNEDKKHFIRTCKLCGKQFEAKTSNATICYDKHYKICKYCNEKFELKREKPERMINRVTCYKDSCEQHYIEDKIKETNNIKYGNDYYLSTDEFKEQSKNTRYNKYGTYHNMKTYKSPMRLKEIRDKALRTIKERYNVDYAIFVNNKNPKVISNPNKKFSNELTNNNIDNELEFKISNYSYDIHILNTNILIEINPTYTHNSTVIPKFSNNQHGKLLDKNYHLNKTKLAEENGYRCIHIFDWDDKEKIINILKSKNKISAKKCSIKEITKQEANEFLDKYHLQNSCKGNNINIGLYYNEELISLITFGKPRYNKNYEYEFLRFCNHKDYSIYGGTNKLFKYFIENYNPTSIISYSDRAKFEGKFFNNLGFIKEKETKPACHWYNIKTKQHFLDNSLRAIGADRLLGTNYGSIEDSGMNNRDIMLNEGFVEVYDCGQSVYVWNK